MKDKNKLIRIYIYKKFTYANQNKIKNMTNAK